MWVLVVNAGSSSLKLRLLGPDDRVEASGDVLVSGGEPDKAALDGALEELGAERAGAVGHRIVHGGTEFSEPVRIDDRVERRLRALTDLAPLHQPTSLAALDAVSAALPDLPRVACFDTAFHARLPAAAATYALPSDWRERFRIRRYGFHGLSHAYAARRAAELVGRPVSELRIVTCHLGAGASLAAVHGGRSVDTTMGFTPLEGLVMATRSGSVDPGLVLWLQRHAGLAADEVFQVLEHRSGVAGLAGSADMRAVLVAAEAGEPAARLAVDVYIHRLCGAVAAMAAAAGGLEVLVFTGGVGENAPAVRRLAAEGLGFLGVGIDEDANQAGAGDRELTGGGATVRTLVVAAREDLEITRGVRQALG
ncbi:MAG TPA: acetate/propionate family kinase [Actinomycetota bacterium]|nr:acetate/propionate family kinase [Actinomycetota bacterium]